MRGREGEKEGRWGGRERERETDTEAAAQRLTNLGFLWGKMY